MAHVSGDSDMQTGQERKTYRERMDNKKAHAKLVSASLSAPVSELTGAIGAGA